MVESGYPDYEALELVWRGRSGRQTPRDIVARLATEISAILATPEVKERLAAQGAEAATATPEEFGRFLDREHARWSVAVKAANVKIEWDSCRPLP
ncbi:MAG: hypothetical protein IPO58_24875 [Betaproteobacteria bacterium]|nr:hypothetical protein [Betaproteobacteria bacterium]